MSCNLYDYLNKSLWDLDFMRLSGILRKLMKMTESAENTHTIKKIKKIKKISEKVLTSDKIH